MIEDTPVGQRVRIIDWGVAKIVADETKANLTRIISTAGESQDDDIKTRGILLGTPKFIAPEHFGQAGAEWSPASDVFALGMILFRMITGRPVRRESYIGECLTAADRQMLKAACGEVGELAQVVLLCLSEIREERLSAGAVQDSLRRIHDRVTGTTVTPREVASTAVSVPLRPLDHDNATHVAVPRGRHDEEGGGTAPVPRAASPRSAAPPEPDEVIEAPRRGPGWVAAAVALLVGIVGGVAVGRFALSEPPAPTDVAASASVASTAPAVPEPAVAEPAVAEPPTLPPDPNRIDAKAIVRAEPKAKVLVLEQGGYKELGTTPVEIAFTHRYEARRLRLEAVEKANVYTPKEQDVFALDVLDKAQEQDPPTIDVALDCANVFDPACNSYQKKFDKAFDKEAGE
jgi:hypothetical protein